MWVFLLWAALCIGVGVWAHKRGRNGWGFGIAAVLFSPLLVGLLVLAYAPEPRT